MLKKTRTMNGKFENLSKNVLLKNVHVVDNKEKINNKKSIILKNGKIDAILDKTPTSFDGEIWDNDNLVLMPGFFDMHVHFREPGREDEETLETGSLTAANGGFTGVACMPNTEPPIDTQEVVSFICEDSKDYLVDVHPVAAITKARAGKELAPIAEMVEAGAVAISDDGSPVMNAEIMRRALEYSKMFGIPILGHEEDANLSNNRHMHEGFYSTKLGIQGIPALSEEIMVARDIMLTEFTGGRFHVCHISSGGSVELVRQAKARGVNVTCEVTPHHFTLTDKEVESYDTNTKMSPPLRSDDDRKAVIEGLKDGTIDAIATDHAPHSSKEKTVAFASAANGIIGLETSVSLSLNLVRDGILSLSQLVEKMSTNPARIIGLENSVRVGHPADVTIIDPDLSYTVDAEEFQSLSRNTPFDGWHLTGKPVLTMVGGRIVYEFGKN